MIIDINSKKLLSCSRDTRLPSTLSKHFFSDNKQQQLKFAAIETTVNTKQRQKTSPNNSLLGKITEIITSDEEPSNLAMLLPLLATLSKDDRWFAWISPPKNLPKSILESAGIALDKVMLLYPDEQNSALKLAKKALSAGTCHAVISWGADLSEHEMSNLEQSARVGASHGILIRKRAK